MPRLPARALVVLTVFAGVFAATARSDRPNPAQAALGGVAATVPADPARRLPDPLPLRRVFLPADKTDTLTVDLKKGTYRKLTKDEFEGRVRAAAVAVEAERTPPALVRAAYTATYSAGHLTGLVEWAVSNPSGRAAPLGIEPLKAAVGEPTWADGTPAVLFRGKLTGRELNGTFLWVERPGGGVVTLPWSHRGTEEPDAERFDLGFPPAAIATLDFTLPADRRPTTPTAGVLLTGPFPAARGDQRRWRLAFGGLSNLTLAVRHADGGAADPAVVSRTARHDLSPGVARSVFDFVIEATRGPSREYAFDVDSGARVTDVGGDPHDRWRFDPPTTPQTTGKLTVTLREPATVARVSVSTTAPLPATATSWAFPGVRAVGGIPGPDTIEVGLHPDLKLDGWTAGDYRVRVPGVGADRTTRLLFQGTLADGDAGRRGPTLRWRPAEAEWASEEAIEWRVEPGRTRLTARLKARVVRGPLPVVAVRAEPGYVLDSVSLTPEDAAVTFGRLPGSPDVWVVEPSRAIPTGQTVHLKLDFQGPSAVPAADPSDHSPSPVAVPFPRFSPVAVADRLGVLAVTPGGGLRASARTVAAVAPLSPAGFSVAYRGREPEGHTLFTPERPVLGVTAVDLAVSGKTRSITLTGWCEDVPFGSLTVFVPGDGGTVRAEGAVCHPLPPLHLLPLVGGTAWQAVLAAGTALDRRGTYWRVSYPRPVRGEFAVTVTHPAADAAADGPLVLPLPKVLGAEVWDAKLNLSAEVSAGYRPADGFDLRAALDEFAPTIQLVRANTEAAPVASAGWRFDDLMLTSGVDADGGLTAVLTGRVTEAVGPALTVTLPAGAAFDSATVVDKWVTPARPVIDRVALPLTDLGGGVPFEVRYRMPTPAGWPLREYRSPLPMLPGEPPIEVRWTFAAGHLPWPTLGGEVTAAETVPVIRSLLPWAVGFVAAGLLAAVGVRRTRPGWKTATTVAAVTVACGVATWVAPDGWRAVVRPPLVAGGVILAVAVIALPRRPLGRPVGHSSRGRAVTAWLVAVFGTLTAGAQQPDATTVYVVNGQDRLAVFAPQAVLDQLDAVAGSKLPSVVLTAAEYTGTAGESGVTFDAVFTLSAVGDGDHPFALPLSGVRVERATLNGEDAYPDASKPDRYGVTVRGPGRHRLAVRFAVAPTAAGSDREARFTGPDVPACRVVFAAGPTGRQPDVPTRRGGQTVNGTTATAEHGGGRAVAVRWREPGTGPTPQATMTVKEAGVWDVSEGDAALTAAFVFRIDGAGVDRLKLELPDGLYPTSVQVRSADPRAAGTGVRGWTVSPAAGGWTPVEVRLQQPADSRVVVLLRARPLKPLGTTTVFRFPRAAGLPDTGRDSLHAVRLGGVRVAGMFVNGAIDFPADALVKDFPPVPEFGFDKAGPTRVVRRSKDAETDVRATLVPTPALTPAAAEVVYTVGQWVEADGAVRGTGKEVGHVEFDVPAGCTLRDVRATGLAGWVRTGNRVQVWARQPAAELTVRWHGVIPRTGGSVELPPPKWPSRYTPAEPPTVRVRAADGWELTPQQVNGFTPKPPATAGEFAYAVEPNAPAARFTVSPAPPAAVKSPDHTPPRSTPPQPPALPPAKAPATPPTTTPADAGALDVWARSAGWLVAFAATTLLGLSGSGRWRPECLTALGVLTAVAVGAGSIFGALFWLVAVVGIGWRAARLVRGRAAD